MTEENRPDPGLLLKKLQYEEKEKEKQTKGKLKIFLGYAAGSGKTYAMLEAAHEAKKHQVDVVAADGNIKRTITVNEPKAEYSANEQTADFGSLQALVRVRIYQMSEVYGRGAVKEEFL